MVYHPPVPDEASQAHRPHIAPGVRVIVVYKWVKALLELLTALAVPALILAGAAEHLHALALTLRLQVVGAWSMTLTNLLVTVTTDRNLALTAVALGLDGALSFLEGWSLGRGYSWGAWLVVIATGGLIPFEIRELVHQARMGRLLVLVVNAIIVLYLVGRIRRERGSRPAAWPERSRRP